MWHQLNSAIFPSIDSWPCGGCRSPRSTSRNAGKRPAKRRTWRKMRSRCSSATRRGESLRMSSGLLRRSGGRRCMITVSTRCWSCSFFCRCCPKGSSGTSDPSMRSGSHPVRRRSRAPKRWPSRASVSGRSSPGGPGCGAGPFGQFWTESGGRESEAGESAGVVGPWRRHIRPAVRAVTGR